MSWLDRLLGREDRITALEMQLSEVSTKLQEANVLAMMYDPDLGLTAQQGGSAYMRRLTQSPRDFAPMQHKRALQLAFYLFETNPIARRILMTTAAYLIGDGFKAAAEYEEESMDEDVQDVIDKFWDDHINLMDLKLPTYALELGMWGELCLIVDVNPVDGLVRLASVDPDRVKEIIVDKTDVVAVSLTPEMVSGGEERLKIIRVDEDPNSKSFGLLVGAKTGPNGKVTETWQATDRDGKPTGEAKKYVGSCFFFRVNNVSNARRGRSDLLAVIDWLDAYDQELFGEMERAQLLKNFIWDVQLEGKSEAEIREWLKINGSPKPGAVRAHNEGVTWQAVTPDLKVKDSTDFANLILGHIATGSQYPKTWLNTTDDVNKATGQVLDEPTFRWMTARQRYLRYIVEQLVTYQLDQAELAGGLTRKKKAGSVRPEPWNVQINVPELRSRDLSAAADSLAKATEGLVNAVSEHFIDLEIAQKVVVMLVEQLGIDVDFDAMVERIDKKIEEEAKLPPVVPPPAPGQPPISGQPSQQPGGKAGQPGASGVKPVPPLPQQNPKGIAV